MNIFKATFSAAALAVAVLTAAGAGDAAQSYAAMKSLDGVWEGLVSTDWPQSGFDGVHMRVRMHLTSSGNALTHEMRDATKPETAAYMGDVTVFYLEGGRILANHYCDADNRVFLQSKPDSDARMIAFDITGITGNIKFGYLRDGIFHLGDPNHHIETWTFIMGNNRAVHVKFDLTRVK
jgi:hypothetical protein